MPKIVNVQTPLTLEKAKQLKAGDNVRISGVLYTARDAAHKRLVEMLESGKELPFDIKDSIVYYVGPAPAPPGKVIGSAGPTTSYRMDPYTEALMRIGLRGMIGKGNRAQAIIDGCKNYGAIYFAAVGGAAALIAKTIKKAEVIAFDDLGPEAIRRLEVEDFPAVVVYDSFGNDFTKKGIPD